MNSKVQVGICLRPLARSEVDAGAESVIKIVGSKRVVATNDSRYQSHCHWKSFILTNLILLPVNNTKYTAATISTVHSGLVSSKGERFMIS